ncbi:MAG: alanine:cation symporter family protein, partial [Schwartzia sp.]|nr:alanine:cation symporter family protein [Schwartzia sp. (in: firmicutes)]
MALDMVWNISDTMNGLMAIPNLICLLWLSKDIADVTFDYEENVVALEKKGVENNCKDTFADTNQ